MGKVTHFKCTKLRIKVGSYELLTKSACGLPQQPPYDPLKANNRDQEPSGPLVMDKMRLVVDKM